jgi:hypothetical protein
MVRSPRKQRSTAGISPQCRFVGSRAHTVLGVHSGCTRIRLQRPRAGSMPGVDGAHRSADGLDDTVDVHGLTLRLDRT